MYNLFPNLRVRGKTVRCLRAGVFLAVLVCTATGSAQESPVPSMPEPTGEMNIEELMQVDVQTVYGASKYQQAVAEAPASVTVITADEIKMYGHRNLAAILQSVRGFSMSYDRNYDYIGIRGFSRPGDYNTRVLLLIDGVRINDAVYDQAAVGNDFPLDADLIERVEVVRGPSHSLYGSNAFFGVINVVTKRGRSLGGAEFSGAGGSFSTYKGRASYGRRFDSGVEVLFSGSLLDSRGQNLYYKEYDTPDQNNGWANGCDGERYGSGFLKLHYRDFTLEGGYLRRRKNIPTGSYGTIFDNPQTQTVDVRSFADFRFEHAYQNRLSILARVSYNGYHYDGDYLYAAGQGTFINKDYARSDTVSTELQLTKELFHRHKLVAGVELRDNFRQDQGNYDTAVYLDDRRRSFSWGIYGQDEFALLDNLVLHAGLRYDHFDSFGGTWNPRLALVYNPLPDTTLKLIYGRAFRAPNAYELYYSTAPFVSNPQLRQETETSYEAVLEQVLTENVNVTVVAFYNRMSDVISETLLPDGSHNFQNSDAYTLRGIEFELQGKWQYGLQGRASCTLQQARRNGADQTVTNSPRQLAKLNLIVPISGGKLFAGVEEQFTDKRSILSGAEAPQFFVTNLTLFSRQLLKGLELSASVYNLFDKRYSDPGSVDHLQATIHQDARSFRVKASYAF